jgi:outer membrane protein assembly factor BamD
MTETTPATGGATGTSLGVSIVTPSDSTPPADSGSPLPSASTGTTASDLPAATGRPDPNNGLPSVGPKNASALPPVEKAAAAPDAVNEVAGKPQPAAEVKTTKGKKNPKPVTDKNDESSSKKKPKKGLDKLNPF